MSKCVAELAPVIDIDFIVYHCRMCSYINFVYTYIIVIIYHSLI